MKRLIELEDLQQINNPESISTLFSKLGYNADCQPLDIDDLELPLKSKEAVKQIYLIANQGNSDLQVLLFQLHHHEWNSDGAIISRMQTIAKSLCQRATRFLLIATTDYRRLLLVSPIKIFDKQMELRFSIHKFILDLRESGFSELNLFEKFAVRSLDIKSVYINQHNAISFAQSLAASPTKISSDDAIRDYLKSIGRIKLLTAEEEILLGRKIKELNHLQESSKFLQEFLGRKPTYPELADSLDLSLLQLYDRLYLGKFAKNKLVESNLRLVVSIAKKYQGRGLDFRDLIQEGNLGLIRASEKFDYTKGYRFSTYATWWIKQGVSRAVQNDSRLIRLPVHVWESFQNIKKTHRSLIKNKKHHSLKDISHSLQKPVNWVRSIIQAFQPIVSLDISIGEEKDTLLEEMISSSHVTLEEQLINSLIKEEIENNLAVNLSPREADILRQRYGLENEDCKSLEAIGKHYNLTRERVRQIEEKALGKLRIFLTKGNENSCSDNKKLKSSTREKTKKEISLSKISFLNTLKLVDFNDKNIQNKIHTLRRCPQLEDRQIVCIIWNVQEDTSDFFEAQKLYQEFLKSYAHPQLH